MCKTRGRSPQELKGPVRCFQTSTPETLITSLAFPVDKQPFVIADVHERRCLRLDRELVLGSQRKRMGSIYQASRLCLPSVINSTEPKHLQFPISNKQQSWAGSGDARLDTKTDELLYVCEERQISLSHFFSICLILSSCGVRRSRVNVTMALLWLSFLIYWC